MTKTQPQQFRRSCWLTGWLWLIILGGVTNLLQFAIYHHFPGKMPPPVWLAFVSCFFMAGYMIAAIGILLWHGWALRLYYGLLLISLPFSIYRVEIAHQPLLPVSITFSLSLLIMYLLTKPIEKQFI